MLKGIYISVIFLSTQLVSNGQLDSADKVFHAYTYSQLCTVGAKSEQDYIIALYGDSLIKIIIYTSGYPDYNTRARRIFTGRCYISGGTLKVQYTMQWEEKRTRFNIETTGRSFCCSWSVPYPPTTYFIDENKITTTTGVIPTLARVATEDMRLLDANFNNWDKTPANMPRLFTP